MRISVLLTLAATLVEVHGFWRLSCSNIQAGRLDSIINPGAVSSHSHTISGPYNFNISSTYDTNQAAFCTSCTIQADKSAYWTPQLYYKTAAGQYKSVRNDGTVVYYLGRGENVQNTVPFPKGFQMLSGNPLLRAYDANTKTYGTTQNPGRPVSDRVSFACLGANYQNGTETPGMYYTNCPNGLRAQVHFPSCWNGVDLYKSDQSHVAYLSQIDNGICPPGYPKRIPHLFYELYYFPNEIDSSDGGQFVWAQGDPTGFGFHGDFLNGWDMDVLQQGISQCLVANQNGVVEDCAPFVPSNDPNTAQNCPLQPLYWDEPVKGTLSDLPGCNPVQPGPAKATPVACNKNPALATPRPKNLDGIKRTPPTKDTTTLQVSVGTATYKGCFKEPDNGRALTSGTTTDNGMTLDACATFCNNKGYAVFGLEYSRECYCGSAVPSLTTAESDCNIACAGDITQFCGGGRRLSVWSLPGVTTGPSVVTPPSGATYLGCYTDNGGSRTLTGGSTTSDSMTYQVCAKYASDNNYKYFGVEYSKECYAGNTISSGATKGGDGNCNMACGGDSTKMCGGAGYITTFQNSAYVAASNPSTVTAGNSVYKYQACYTEGNNGRALPDKATTSSSMTVETCVQYCAGFNYAYAGVEYGQECYCGNAGPTNGAAVAPNGDAECSTYCVGNKQQYCGGSRRLNIWKLQASSRVRRNFLDA